MDRLTILALIVAGLAGCAAGPYGAAPYAAVPSEAAVYYDNPTLLPSGSAEQVWEHVVDVVDDYFDIAQEIPITEMDVVGRLDTVPLVGATLMEPWRHDSANFDERLGNDIGERTHAFAPTRSQNHGFHSRASTCSVTSPSGSSSV